MAAQTEGEGGPLSLELSSVHLVPVLLIFTCSF